jgi:hypothetical protein
MTRAMSAPTWPVQSKDLDGLQLCQLLSKNGSGLTRFSATGDLKAAAKDPPS